MPAQIGDVLNGRYWIKTLLGVGRIGAVYRAFDILDEKPCVVKEFHPGNLPSRDQKKAVEQFRKEARLLLTLKHPNLPKVTELFDVGGNYYLVMPFIEGHDLAEMMHERGTEPFSEKKVIEWISQVLEAVAYCHAHGVVHRDIKPANVIIGANGKAYLVDFGIAKSYKISGKTSGKEGTAFGYAPPEQFSQDQIDYRSDIYSLGAILDALLTAREPGKVDEPKKVEDSPTSRQEINPILPAMKAVIQRAMSIHPADRFQSVEEMRLALRRAVEESQAGGKQIKPVIETGTDVAEQVLPPPTVPGELPRPPAILEETLWPARTPEEFVQPPAILEETSPIPIVSEVIPQAPPEPEETNESAGVLKVVSQPLVLPEESPPPPAVPEEIYQPRIKPEDANEPAGLKEEVILTPIGKEEVSRPIIATEEIPEPVSVEEKALHPLITLEGTPIHVIPPEETLEPASIEEETLLLAREMEEETQPQAMPEEALPLVAPEEIRQPHTIQEEILPPPELKEEEVRHPAVPVKPVRPIAEETGIDSMQPKLSEGMGIAGLFLPIFILSISAIISGLFFERNHQKGVANKRDIRTAKKGQVLGFIGIIISCLFWIILAALQPGPRPEIVPVPANTSTITSTFSPTMTSIPTDTPTPTLTETPTPAPTFTDTVPPPSSTSSLFVMRPKDGMKMVFVPAGEFSMGTNEPGWNNAQPQHKVVMSDYWIDETDVTNAMFQKFIIETGWRTEAENKTFGEIYRQDKKLITVSNATWLHPRDPKSNFDGLDHPVVQVSWNDANGYCLWAGRDWKDIQVNLPTEAQWEKAARGTNAREYPWVGGGFGPDKLNYGDDHLYNWIVAWNRAGNKDTPPWGGGGDDGYLFTSPVGNYPSGASPYGAMDMAGNVMQWVYDFYKEGFQGQKGVTDPEGPSSGVLHVLKGSFWKDTNRGSFTFIRNGKPANYTTDFIGFRCAASKLP